MQADLMAISALGAHAATVLTGYTVQDTTGVSDFVSIDADQIDDQARTILEDMPIAAFKIGVLGDVGAVAAVAEIVSDYPDLPVVLDPVLASGRGDVFADDETLEAMRSLLFPQLTLVTPNSYEARRIATSDQGDDDASSARSMSLDAAAAKILGWGPGHVLITGTHEATGDVINTLYAHDGDACVRVRSDAWARLPGSYHGSGCTLASAIAACLADGRDLETALHDAQRYTWLALRAAFRPGMGQAIPDRFYRMREAQGPSSIALAASR